jgi:hypothetical protein
MFLAYAESAAVLGLLDVQALVQLRAPCDFCFVTAGFGAAAAVQAHQPCWRESEIALRAAGQAYLQGLLWEAPAEGPLASNALLVAHPVGLT